MGEPFYHDAILNRLGVFHQNGGEQVYYSPESFADASMWDGIPLIYAPTTGEPIIHPGDYKAIEDGIIPEGYIPAGYVAYGYFPYSGDERIDALLAITNPEVEQLARDRKLAISTGFYADQVEWEGNKRIVGTIKPNHVLVFEKGACASCWSNDDAAMILNLKEGDSTPMSAQSGNEEKGMLRRMRNKFGNTQPERQPDPKPDIEPEKGEDPTPTENMNQQNEELEQLKAANTALLQKVEQLEAEKATAEKDKLWNTVKATVDLPAGWLGENEPATRAKFENNRDTFYLELIAHNAKIPFANNKAQGKCGCGESETEAVKTQIANVQEATGYTIVMEDNE